MASTNNKAQVVGDSWMMFQVRTRSKNISENEIDCIQITMYALDQRTLEKLHAKPSKPLDGDASTILNNIGTTVRDLFTFTYQIRPCPDVFFLPFFRSVIGSLVGKLCKIVRLINCYFLKNSSVPPCQKLI